MAEQLFNRLARVWDGDPQSQVHGEFPNWPRWKFLPQFGSRMPDVRSFVLHETSGWPPRSYGRDGFFNQFFGGRAHKPHSGETAQLFVAGDGTVMLGMELPLVTGHATFINGWALASETGHGWGNYRGNPHIGPYTSTDESVDAQNNPTPANLLGLPAALTRKLSNQWIPLSGNDAMATAADDDDLPGLKVWIRHQGFAEVVVGWWTTPSYAGPWRQAQRVPEMLFTDAQYRGWALLVRWVAEEHGLPRNFPVLPHKTRSPGYGLAAAHGMIRDGHAFRAIVNADEVLSRSLAALGITQAQLATDALTQQVYAAAVQQAPAGFERNTMWRRVFDHYRGFHGHGFSGDPDRNNDHDCPGPMFDWHRLAREVWDWWWHPFDFDAANSLNNVQPRPYSLDTRDGDTPLTEHWFSTPSTLHEGVRVPGIHGASGSPATYQLTASARIYALATGDLVAARFPAETDQVSLAFVVVRHEVFHQLDPRAGAPAAAGQPAVAAGRIDYDTPPTAVYSLYMHLGRPQGMSFDEVVPANPEWLNRMLMRAKECALGVQFHAAAHPQHPDWQVPQDVWDSRPPGQPLRPTVLEAWDSDDRNYRPTLDRLRAGQLALAPRNPFSTPIRVLLGDYLGNAGVIAHTGTQIQHGVRVEVFSRNLISDEFMLTETDAARRWVPQQGPLIPAVYYPSEWSQIPSGNEKTALQAVGVNTDTDLVSWWDRMQLVTTANPRYPEDARLDDNGWAVHYDPHPFMAWLNTRTWHSEWPKYQVADPAGIPAAPRRRA